MRRMARWQIRYFGTPCNITRPCAPRETRWRYNNAEHSFLPLGILSIARMGNKIWQNVIDTLLRIIANDELAFFLRIRGAIQIILVIALALLPASIIFYPGRLLVASGLLFDIAGVLRVFLLEELTDALEPFVERERIPSVIMRELIMPEASGPYTSESPPISLFYYKKRGVLFLFVGFVLQMVGGFLG
jgi:hypothetical protein